MTPALQARAVALSDQLDAEGLLASEQADICWAAMCLALRQLPALAAIELFADQAAAIVVTLRAALARELLQ